jgi:predicted flavoprotein YhiN
LSSEKSVVVAIIGAGTAGLMAEETLFRQGVTVRVLASIAGHRSIATTQR